MMINLIHWTTLIASMLISLFQCALLAGILLVPEQRATLYLLATLAALPIILCGLMQLLLAVSTCLTTETPALSKQVARAMQLTVILLVPQLFILVGYVSILFMSTFLKAF